MAQDREKLVCVDDSAPVLGSSYRSEVTLTCPVTGVEVTTVKSDLRLDIRSPIL